MNEPVIWQFSLNALHAGAWIAALLVALILLMRFLTLRHLVIATLVATLVLVMLGAYVRLSNAGLGCPDWPGCYGKISPSHASAQIQAAELARPDGPVSRPNAWREMLHRYLASFVGVMILAIAIRTVNRRRLQQGDTHDPAYGIGLPLALLAIVVLQGLLGKWTVTLLLMPAIVTLHLLGGMAIVALLAWLCARHIHLGSPTESGAKRSQVPLAAALLVLGLQIALGAWVSANYAALACVDFPTCHGRWQPDMSFSGGFQFFLQSGAAAPLSNDALTAIHWTHRVGALVTLLIVAFAARVAMKKAGLHKLGSALLVLLAAQISLGIGNVLGSLPLAVAVAHNGVAALLLAALVMLNFATRSPSGFSR